MIIEYQWENEESQERPQKERHKFEVLYQDEQIVVFNKSAGISVIPERYVQGVSLKEIAEGTLGRLWTVHRLDKDTSGVVVFGRNAAAHKSLNDQFEERSTKKLYVAILEGELPEDEMIVDIPIAADPTQPGRMRPSASGKPSLTIFRITERFKGFSLVEAELVTGRTHQIRVHARALGFPLAVDPMYGNRSEILLSQFKRKYKDYGREEKPLVSRTTLHAQYLEFRHPATEERVNFTAPIPKDLHALLTQLRKVRRQTP